MNISPVLHMQFCLLHRDVVVGSHGKDLAHGRVTDESRAAQNNTVADAVGFGIGCRDVRVIVGRQ